MARILCETNCTAVSRFTPVSHKSQVRTLHAQLPNLTGMINNTTTIPTYMAMREGSFKPKQACGQLKSQLLAALPLLTLQTGDSSQSNSYGGAA